MDRMPTGLAGGRGIPARAEAWALSCFPKEKGETQRALSGRLFKPRTGICANERGVAVPRTRPSSSLSCFLGSARGPPAAVPRVQGSPGALILTVPPAPPAHRAGLFLPFGSFLGSSGPFPPAICWQNNASGCRASSRAAAGAGSVRTLSPRRSPGLCGVHGAQGAGGKGPSATGTRSGLAGA